MNLPSWLTGGFRFSAPGLNDLPLMQKPEWLGGGIDPALLREAKGPQPEGTVASRGGAPRKAGTERARSPWSQMSWGERLSILGAGVKDLDPQNGGNLDRLQAMQRRDTEQAREEARRRAAADAYQASFVNGRFDPRVFAANMGQLGEPVSIGEALAIEEAMAPKPERLVFGDFGGPEGVPDGVPDVGYDSDVRAQLDARRRGQPSAPQAPAFPPPPPGFVLDRPTEAPSPGGAAPQGFSGYDDLRGFVSGQVPGARFTSGYRSQAEQDALRRRGVTRATRSAHTYGMGQDFVPPGSPDTWGPIADELRRSGRFRKVIIERGGPGQGTGAHIHLEPY